MASGQQPSLEEQINWLKKRNHWLNQQILHAGLRRAIEIVREFEGGNDGNDMRDVIIEALEAELEK